jgi:DNA-directed RNA polymerase specialized sigma subunit
MTEKDKYKLTEHWLYKLNALKTRIINLEQQYKEQELQAECDGIDYSKDKLCQTFKFNSQTENVAVDLIHTEMMKKSLQTRVDMMERSLEMLNSTERKIIELKYFKNEPWFNIAYEVQYCERQCKNIRKNAIKKLTFAIFGEDE